MNGAGKSVKKSPRKPIYNPMANPFACQLIREPKAPTGLARYFPMIRSREQVLEEIESSLSLHSLFLQWEPRERESFLDYCTGTKGFKILYDGVFKEIFNPERTPERLEELLSLLLGRDVSIQSVLPNDSVRLGAESSLIYTDLVVRLEDGSYANVEIQKLGARYPAERAACYSSDLMMRQYKQVRGVKGKDFVYQDMKAVYTIIFMEQSPKSFHNLSGIYCHTFQQVSNTGLSMNLLQKYLFLPLDIFRETMDNKSIETELEAWLSFLSFDSPERILELCRNFPQFQAMYEDIYELCLNTERVMDLFSRELREIDKNMVRFMVDDLQREIEEIREEKETIRKEREALQKKREALQKRGEALRKEKETLQKERETLQKDVQQKKTVIELKQNKAEIERSRAELEQKDSRIHQMDAQLSEEKALRERAEAENRKLRAQLEALMNTNRQ